MKKPMSLCGVMAAIACSVVACSQATTPQGATASAAPSAMPIAEGEYAVQGTNPGGSGSYAGTLTMTKKGDVYEMAWRVGTNYRGVGIQHGNVLSVGWGTPGQAGYGVVSYTVAANGTLTGHWATASSPALGTETLTPKK